MRRNDELQRFLALVPDDVTLMKTSVKPTPHADEDDPALVREVWIKASSGAPSPNASASWQPIRSACDGWSRIGWSRVRWWR